MNGEVNSTRVIIITTICVTNLDCLLLYCYTPICIGVIIQHAAASQAATNASVSFISDRLSFALQLQQTSLTCTASPNPNNNQLLSKLKPTKIQA
jgi:hypothetical protein